MAAIRDIIARALTHKRNRTTEPLPPASSSDPWGMGVTPATPSEPKPDWVRAVWADLYDDISSCHRHGDLDGLNGIIWDCDLRLGDAVVEEADLSTAQRLAALARIDAAHYLGTVPDIGAWGGCTSEDPDVRAVVSEIKVYSWTVDKLRSAAYQAEDLDGLARIARLALAETLAYAPAWVERPAVVF